MTNSDIATEMLAHVREIDDRGELPLVARRRVTDNLTRCLSDSDAVTFRALLGLACAKRAWPVWQSVFEIDTWPMDLAEAALLSLGPIEETQAVDSRELMEVKGHLDEKFLLDEEYFPAVYAGFASWAVARDVLTRKNQDQVTGDSELQIPPDEWDPCFLASLALAGGATWEGIGSRESRHEFWEWYLASAIPGAFMAIHSE